MPIIVYNNIKLLGATDGSARRRADLDERDGRAARTRGGPSQGQRTGIRLCRSCRARRSCDYLCANSAYDRGCTAMTADLGLLILTMSPPGLLSVIGLLVGISFIFSGFDLLRFGSRFHLPPAKSSEAPPDAAG